MANLEELLKELAPKVKDYEARQKERMETGFNLFYLISDYYYRETFHSDIIAAILDPKGKHDNGKGYIDLFIEMINKDSKLSVDKNFYSDYSKVTKELPTDDCELQGRIDIFIEGDVEDKDGKRHCIVIENKLNNAGDTYKQLPKYYGFLKDKYNIDAFVYLPLDPNKMPDKTGWTDDEISLINSIFVKIPAYKEGEINLIDHWLTPAEKEGNDEAKFVIQQYKSVLNNLTIDIMDNKEIVDILSKKEYFETMLAIINCEKDFCKKVKEEFISSLQKQLVDGKYSWNNPQDDKYEISKGQWVYVIERNRNSGFWRGLEYRGSQKLPITEIEKKWGKTDCCHPLGWDYFEGDLYDWTRTSTLRQMRNGEFVKQIIEEVDDAYSLIDKLGLPK